MASIDESRGVIGYWLSEKKLQKFNLTELSTVCRNRGYDLVKLDLNKSFNEQGPFSIILYKCTEILIKASAGDQQAMQMIENLESYHRSHPEVPIIDNLDKVKRLLNRYVSYMAIRKNPNLNGQDIFVPTSAELTSEDTQTNIQILKDAGVTFPFVAKPCVAQGTTEAHSLAIIFNEDGVADCRPPSVAQTFVNHNAIQFKVFSVGDQYHVEERPSLKNFYSTENRSTIFFKSSDVSKSDSTSSLCSMDPDDPMLDQERPERNDERFKIITDAIRHELGLDLVGVDVVVENGTGRYAIIDVNSFPSYDGYPNLMETIVDYLEKIINVFKCGISRSESTLSTATDDEGKSRPSVSSSTSSISDISTSVASYVRFIESSTSCSDLSSSTSSGDVVRSSSSISSGELQRRAADTSIDEDLEKEKMEKKQRLLDSTAPGSF